MRYLHKVHEEVKLSSMHKYMPYHEDVCGSGYIDPHILTSAPEGSKGVSFVPWSLYS